MTTTTVPATAGVRGPRILAAALREGVEAWFTGSADRPDPVVGVAGNLSHHRPYAPTVLARDRAAVGDATGTDPGTWHLMTQVHGREVATVGASTPPGAELRGVDAMVTAERDRVLAVAVADCVPVLLAGPGTIGVAHAGRRGVQLGVVPATVDAMLALDGVGADRAVVGPAIGGCCYEVPARMRDEVAAVVPEAAATTTWGTPSLDLPTAVLAVLRDLGVSAARSGSCTRCTPGWFSHRRDPGTGRQLGLVVRR